MIPIIEQSEGYERGRARNAALTKFSAAERLGLTGEKRRSDAQRVKTYYHLMTLA
jgi:hypothetical protein